MKHRLGWFSRFGRFGWTGWTGVDRAVGGANLIEVADLAGVEAVPRPARPLGCDLGLGGPGYLDRFGRARGRVRLDSLG
jgi:hypothetical protein